MKKKEPAEIQITLWNFHLFAKGDAAVAALKIPLALALILVAIALATGIAWRAGWML